MVFEDAESKSSRFQSNVLCLWHRRQNLLDKLLSFLVNFSRTVGIILCGDSKHRISYLFFIVNRFSCFDPPDTTFMQRQWGSMAWVKTMMQYSVLLRREQRICDLLFLFLGLFFLFCWNREDFIFLESSKKGTLLNASRGTISKQSGEVNRPIKSKMAADRENMGASLQLQRSQKTTGSWATSEKNIYFPKRNVFLHIFL